MEIPTSIIAVGNMVKLNLEKFHIYLVDDNVHGGYLGYGRGLNDNFFFFNEINN